MRWQIPLAAALVAFVAVSCDQQPVEPVDESPVAETASFDANPARVYEQEFGGTFDLCGTEVAFGGWLRFPNRFAYGGEKMSHYLDNTTAHGWAESASGEKWRFNESYNEQSQWVWESSPNVWSIHHRVHFIGLGQAPDFYMNSWFRHTVNANGDLVTYWDFEDPLCPS